VPDIDHFALFFAAAFLPAIAPGPGLFYVASGTLAGGRAEVSDCAISLLRPTPRTSKQAVLF